MTATSACPGMRSSSERTIVVLPGADFARELNETAGLAHAVQQMRERFRMPLAHEQVARIGCDRERLFAEAEKARIHG